jgi:hypothetical protein
LVLPVRLLRVATSAILRETVVLVGSGVINGPARHDCLQPDRLAGMIQHSCRVGRTLNGSCLTGPVPCRSGGSFGSVSSRRAKEILHVAPSSPSHCAAAPWTPRRNPAGRRMRRNLTASAAAARTRRIPNLQVVSPGRSRRGLELNFRRLLSC